MGRQITLHLRDRYSPLCSLPIHTEDYGAAMYYNTAVPLPDGFQKGRLMKYGVISTTALRQDLLDWTWLYAAGKR